MKSLIVRMALACLAAVSVLIGGCSKSSPTGNDGNNNHGGTRPDLAGTWTVRTSGTSADIYSVAWSGTIFVAAGGGGLLTSPDGITWTPRSYAPLSRVVWLASRFIAVGPSSAMPSGFLCLTSTDGLTWTSHDGGGGDVALLQSGQLMAVARDKLMWSSDYGATWAAYEAMPVHTNGPDLWAINATPFGVFAYGSWYRNGIFVSGTVKWPVTATGFPVDSNGFQQNLGERTVWTGHQLYSCSGWSTTDGVTWVLHSGAGGRNIIWDDSLYVQVSDNGTCRWSADGGTWQHAATGISNSLYDIAYSGSRYVAVGAGGVIVTRP